MINQINHIAQFLPCSLGRHCLDSQPHREPRVPLLKLNHSPFAAAAAAAYLSDGHLGVLLLLLQLLLQELQVVLRRQRGEGLGAGAAGDQTLGCHCEDRPSVKVLRDRKRRRREEKVGRRVRLR